MFAAIHAAFVKSAAGCSKSTENEKPLPERRRPWRSRALCFSLHSLPDQGRGHSPIPKDSFFCGLRHALLPLFCGAFPRAGRFFVEIKAAAERAAIQRFAQTRFHFAGRASAVLASLSNNQRPNSGECPVGEPLTLPRVEATHVLVKRLKVGYRQNRLPTQKKNVRG